MSSSLPVPYWRLSNFYFFYFASLGALITFLPLYLGGRGFDVVQISQLVAVTTATKIVAPIVWGWIADHFSGRRLSIIRWGAGLSLLGLLPILLEPSFWGMVTLLVVFSFFWNAILAQFEVLTLHHLGTAVQRYSSIRLWGSIGFIVIVICAGQLFDFVSIHYFPALLLSLLFFIWHASLLVPSLKERRRAESHSESFVTELLKPRILYFLIICFLMQVAHGVYYALFSLHLESVGYSTSVIGFLWGIGVIAEVLIFMIMSALMRRMGFRVLCIVSLFLAAVRWSLIAFFVDSLIWMLLAQVMHAFTFGVFHALAISRVHVSFSPSNAGRGQAFYSAVSFGAGGVVGNLVAGQLWEHFSPQWTFMFATIVSLVAVAIAVRCVYDD